MASIESELMNSVVAFIQPFQLENVVDALRNVPGFPGMSVSEVRGFGRHGAHPPQAGEREEVDPFKPKVRIEIFCRAHELSAIVETIRETARTGNPGDGKILIGTLAWAVRIRTGEEGPSALISGHASGRHDHP